VLIEPLPSKHFGNCLQSLMFFAAFYVGLWKWVDVRLIYHGGAEIRDFPVYYWGWDCLRETCRYPGGSAQYLAAMLAQSLFHSWWGALILTLQAGVIFLTTKAALQATGAARPQRLAYVLPMILLALYAGYNHASTPVTALAIALSFLGLYLWVGGPGVWLRLGLLLLFSALLYALAAEALLVFALVATILELHRRAPRLMIPMPLLLAGVLACLEGWFVFGYAPSEALGTLLPVPWTRNFLSVHGAGSVVALYLALPLLTLAVAFRRAFAPGRDSLGSWITRFKPRRRSPGTDATTSRTSHDRPAKATRAAQAGWRSFSGGSAWTLETGVLLLVTAATLYVALDAQLKTLLAVDYFACHRMWPQVIRAAGKHPTQLYVLCSVAQAAYHTGNLTRTLPVVRTPADLLLAEQVQLRHWKRGDLMFDLGYANLALHHLIEAVEFCGERPLLLKRIALVNLALGNVSTARIYLNALTRVPFHAGWARERLAALESDPGLARDDEVNRLRELKPKRDTVVLLSVDETLLLLLKANPRNRMAFEYLMTYYLLSKDLDGFANNLPRLGDFPGFEVSSMWQEAKVLAALRLGEHPNLRGQRLEPAAQQRLKTVVETIRACGGDKNKARKMLPNYYEQSYLYYYFFH
jgi:hypothetical protein